MNSEHPHTYRWDILKWMCRWRQNWLFLRRESAVNWTSTGQDIPCVSVDNTCIIALRNNFQSCERISLKSESDNPEKPPYTFWTMHRFSLKHHFPPHGSVFLHPWLQSLSIVLKHSFYLARPPPARFYKERYWGHVDSHIYNKFFQTFKILFHPASLSFTTTFYSRKAWSLHPKPSQNPPTHSSISCWSPQSSTPFLLSFQWLISSSF